MFRQLQDQLAMTTVVILLLLAGCSPQQTEKSGLVYCSEGNPASFNPQIDSSSTTSDASSYQLYDRLLEYDPETGEIVPGLASSWLVSSDGLTYTMQLRRDVAFHHTDYFKPSRNFNADDVLFSLNRWRDPEHPFYQIEGHPAQLVTGIGQYNIIKSIRRINGYRVEIKLKTPDSSFLASLATDLAIAFSAEYGAQLVAKGKKAQIDNNPVGTGPFKFKGYRKNRFVRFQANPSYWKNLNTPEQLIFDITNSSELRLAKLLTRECDVIALPDYSEIEFLKQKDGIVLDEKPGLNVGFWAFNTSKPPFDNPNVRKALAMAMDKNALLDAVYFDQATEANSIIPPNSWAWEALLKTPPYNPVSARELLDEAGVKPGFRMTVWAMPVARAYNPNATKMAELIKQYLAKVDIQVEVISYEWETFRNLLKQGQHDSVLIGWSADNGDPDNFYRPLLTCPAVESGTNRAMWCNEEYDDYINQALNYTAVEDRKVFYRMANALLAEQLPLVPIAHAYRYQAYRDRVTGLLINPFGGIRFDTVELR